jgi:RHS repeat-associated protein
LADENPFRYRGYYYDVETGFYYVSSRYYDPEIGIFINADIYVSTGQGILGYNMFSYALNNPINRLDAAYRESTEYMNLIDIKFMKVLENKASELSLYTEKLKVLNPLSIMEKGFSIVYKDNKIVKSVNELKPNDKVSIKLIDGSKNAVIMEE